MAVLTMREALNQAMREEMRRDQSVFLLGEEVGAYQGAYKITQGLLQEFGEWRVRDTPIAEEVIAGIAVGAASSCVAGGGGGALGGSSSGTRSSRRAAFQAGSFSAAFMFM